MCVCVCVIAARWPRCGCYFRIPTNPSTYQPRQYKKDFEVAVIVELRPPKAAEEEEFVLKLDDGEM